MSTTFKPNKISLSLILAFLILATPASTLSYASGAQSVTTAVAPNFNAAVFPPSLMSYNNATGTTTAVPYVATLYNGTQITVGGSPAPQTASSDGRTTPMSSTGQVQPLCSPCQLYSRPYIGGYMSSEGCSPNTDCNSNYAEAEISFPGTSPSVIPSGNFLEGTINLHGADCCTGGRDYLIRAAHVLYPNGVHGVVADMWRTCEGGNWCGLFASATELTAYILDIYGLSVNQPIYLEIGTGTNGIVGWLYSYDDVNWMQYYSYTPGGGFINSLYLGTLSGNSHNQLNGESYYYQFGVWAQSTFTGTFNVDFQNPSYWMNGGWTAIPQAYSIHGPNSYFDNTWALSSNSWNLDANIPSSSPTVTFYYSSCCSIGDLQKLWG